MENWIDPLIDPQGGWKGDAVQIRIKTSSNIVHITSWFYTVKQLPWVSLHYGMWDKDPKAFDINDGSKIGIQVAFKKNEDAKGYNQEIAIPWKVLGISMDSVSQFQSIQLSCGLEFFWGNVKGKNWPEHRFAHLINPQNPHRSFFWTDPTAWGQIKLTKACPVLTTFHKQKNFQLYPTKEKIPISYDLPFDSHVSLVIEDQTGHRLRNLIGDAPRRAGKNIDWWDGKDDYGQKLPPGKYLVRGLFHNPFKLRYEFSFGNPGNPPWLTPDGQGGWLSNHENPLAISCDKNSIYVSALMAEGACTVMALDLEGHKKWGNGGIAGGMLARLGPFLYMVVGGSCKYYDIPAGEIRLVRFNAENGEQVLFKDNQPYITIYHFNPSLNPPPPREPEGEAIENGNLDAKWCQLQVMGFTSNKNRLYCSLFYENKVLVLDEEGHILRSFHIEQPTGVVADGNGIVYVISNHSILKINQQGDIFPFITSGLDHPIGLALDQEGMLYVSDWGRSMNVKVFSREGKLLREIGKHGGRPLLGEYDPQGMFLPFGITIDEKNRLWVAEWDQSPRRISVWSTQGNFLKEYCGSTFYAGLGCNINPFNPSEGIVMANKVDLDWQKGQWRVASTLWRSNKSTALFGLGPEMYHQFLSIEQRNLIVSGFKNYLCISELKENGYAKPLTAMGKISYFLKENFRLPKFISEKLFADPIQLKWAKEMFPSIFLGEGWKNSKEGNYQGREQLWDLLNYESLSRGYPLQNSFLWIDLNGDGLVQENELEIFSEEELGGPIFRGEWWAPVIGPDLSSFWINQNKDVVSVWKIPCEGFNDSGSPIYSIKKAKRIFGLFRPPSNDEPQGWCDSKGNLLINHDPLEMLTQDGKVLWHYPNPWSGVHGSHSAPQASPGRLIGPLYVIGSAILENVGEIFCIAGNLGERYFFTTDGLYIGSVFKDCRAAPDTLPQKQMRRIEITDTSAGGESFGGQFFKNPTDNNFYLIGPVSDARECSVVTKIEGLETISRLPSQSVLINTTNDEPELGLKNNPSNTFLTITPLSHNLAGNPNPNLFHWESNEETAHWSFDSNHQASASWTFDKEYFYIGFHDVMDESPMINFGKNPFQLFKTGDAAIFECGQSRNISKESIKMGDFRLVFSVYQGKPIAVIYRYLASGSKKPMTFASPIGSTTIDQVKILNDAKISIIREKDRYSLYATIPIKELELDFSHEEKLLGDFGIIYSDKYGTIDSLRMYWSNKNTGMVNDLSIESSIDPKQWGIFWINK
ncbi:hypothetical protein [Methylacidiphilum kamchatkense]